MEVGGTGRAVRGFPVVTHPLGSDFVRDQLVQRTLDLNGRTYNPEGEYVLYWMQSTQRLEENWALRAAIRTANRINRPLLIHQGLDPTYPYASDRHHTFILQGARETAQRAEAMGLPYQFALRSRRDGDRRIVDRLAERAYVTFTDLFPTAGVRERSERFASRARCRVLAVESSCTVPHGLFERAEYAARTIRPKIARLLAHALEPVDAITAPVHADARPRCTMSRATRDIVAELTGDAVLPIATMSDDDIAIAVAACEIDHTVPAVSTRGGRHEARLRLVAFVDGALPRYAARRNEASDDDGTSGLSPWLHHGQLSAAEVARAARESAADPASVTAFLEQVTVWRELAYNWCIRTRAHSDLASLPSWAQASMAAHAGDPRPALLDLATLEGARSGDALWDAAQRQLVTTGLIHNYPRMLWGKTALLWTPSYEDARTTLFHLNDKWALDGRDPNSVGGIMWCFGLWDRPWGNKPVWGGIRPMVTHRGRLKFDVEAYVRRHGASASAAQLPLAPRAAAPSYSPA